MEIKILGTGTAPGLPMIAFDHKGVNLEDRRNWRTRSSVHVELAGHNVQVDAGPDLRMQCLEHGVENVDTFILTHGHADHILGMDDLRRFCSIHGGKALDVFSTTAGLQRVQDIFFYAVRETPERKGYPAFRLHEMPKRMDLAGGKIHSVLLPHGSVEVLGLVFEEESSGKKFSYFIDCKELPDEAVELAKGSDVVILDALRYEPHPTHMSIDEAVEAAQKIGAPITYLSHLSYPVDHATCEENLPENVRLAYDGFSIKL